MRLRDVDSLKSWITDTVSLISDAEPEDLAKYIVALLRKDKTEKELEELCQKELEIFFKENTMEFLSKLFSTLKTESYITEKAKKINKEPNVLATNAPEGEPVRSRLSRNEEKQNTLAKSAVSRIDEKQINENTKVRSSKGEGRDVRSRLGDVNSRDYRRHRDDHDRRERRKRSRSRDRSPFHRRRPVAGRQHHEDLRQTRMRRRSRERSRERSWSRSPFNESGFRSAKYFSTLRQRSRTLSDDKDDVYHAERTTPAFRQSSPMNDFDVSVHSRSSSIDLKDNKEFRITVPLDNLMNNQNTPLPVQPHYQGFTPMPGYLNIPPISSDLPANPPSNQLTSVSATSNSAAMMTTQNSLSSLMQTPPPPLPIAYGAPSLGALPRFAIPHKLLPPTQPLQAMVAAQPPQILQHFARFPPTNSLVPSLPPQINYQSPQIVIPKEPVSRQVVGFTNLGSFPHVELSSIKSRLGIKVESQPETSIQEQSSTLFINNIPPLLNNISSINQQFSKFGSITNIQVHYDGNPGAALVSFVSHESAASAYESSEPVFNNRFIEVLWHRNDATSPRVVLADTRRPVKERLGGLAPEVTLELSETVRLDGDCRDAQEVGNLVNVRAENLVAQVDSAKQQRTVVLMPSSDSSSTSLLPQTSQFVSNRLPPAKVRRTFPTNKQKVDLMDEVMKRKIELNKKKRLFLEEQLQKQKSLLEELAKPGLCDEEKTALKKKLKEMSFESQKLKYELDGSMKLVKQMPFRNTFPSPIVSGPELKKQILDAELDLMSKMKDGQDTTELDKNIKLLKMQASSFQKRNTKRSTFNKFASKPVRSYFRSQGKPPRALAHYGNPQLASRLLDRRPRQLIVTCFEEDKKNGVIAHLGRFGKMEKFENVEGDEPSIVVTYSTRKEAEKVARLASNFEDANLKFAWPKTSAQSSAANPSKGVESQKSELVRDRETEYVRGDVDDGEEEEDDDDDSDTMIELMIEDDGDNDLVEQSLIGDAENLLDSC